MYKCNISVFLLYVSAVLCACGDKVLSQGRIIDIANDISYVEILDENICTTTYSVYDNALLCRYLQEELDDVKKIQEKCETNFYAEYVLYDFNDDGKDDYLVSLAGAGYSGSRGNSTSIYITVGEQTLEEVFHATVQFFVGEDETNYGRVIVLNSKSGGFYDLIFEGSHIWQYDEEEHQYRFDCERTFIN